MSTFCPKCDNFFYHQEIDKKLHLVCKNCGYKTIKLSWQCPTCRSWELSTPINFVTNN